MNVRHPRRRAGHPFGSRADPSESDADYIDDARAADDKEALRILDLHAN
jgi:hypothetical protein